MANTAKIITSNRWSNVLINALLTLTIGIVLVFVPDTVYSMIIIGIGIVMITSGIGFLLYNYMSKTVSPKAKTMLFVQAIINIIVGLFMVFQSIIVYNSIIYFLAIWLIITGAMQLFSAPSQKNIIPNTNVILLNGVIALGLGVIILIWPQFPLVFIGYLTIFISTILFYYSYISFKHRNQNINFNYENTVDVEEIIDNKK
ncbi:MAG: DUF308 domain-containing protein [Bacteroidales bacterium]|nr:DUF308 domain-containing protein [Bacteroidales bacterium]